MSLMTLEKPEKEPHEKEPPELHQQIERFVRLPCAFYLLTVGSREQIAGQPCAARG